MIGIVITHNKVDNAAQIEALKPLIEKQTEQHNGLDEDGNEIIWETYYYTIKGLEHKVKFYQIIPYGVTPPANLDEIDSHKVFYGEGDEDKTGDHPRFFNWGLKRATDYGADFVVHLKDYTKFDVADIKKSIEKGDKKADKAYGKISRKDDNQIAE
jgi:hypothetical protein